MQKSESLKGKLTFSEVTRENLDAFEKLIIRKNCWCVYWRMPKKEFYSISAKDRKEKMEHIVESGEIPGILAFLEENPVGWCSIAPRSVFPGINETKIFSPVDDEPVWSIVCFYVDRRYRKSGVTSELIREALSYASRNGAKIVEAYPMDVEGEYKYPSAAYTGFLSTFLKIGFVVVSRRSDKHPMVRYAFNSAKSTAEM